MVRSPQGNLGCPNCVSLLEGMAGLKMPIMEVDLLKT